MKKLPLIIGIALPLVFIVMVMLFAFLPNISIKPQHDFIYSIGDNRDYYYDVVYNNTYELVGGKVILKPIVITDQNLYPNRRIEDRPKLYRYSASNNTVQEVSLEEAQALFLVPGPSSPDGYTIEYKYGHDGIFELFGSNNNDSGYFITNGRGVKKIPSLTADYRYYYNNYNLIGWVK